MIKIKKKKSVCFKSININENNNDDNDNNKFNKEIIKNSKTENIKLLKLSKSLTNKKNKDGNLDKLKEEIKSSKINQTEEGNISIERDDTSQIKKNKLKKRPSKFSSLKNVSYERKLNNRLDLEENFIPNSNFSFMLNLDKMSFIPLYKKGKYEKESLNILKNEAMTKFKKYQIMKKYLKKNKIALSSDESSYEESESNEEENYSSLSSNISDSIEKKQNKQDLKLNEKSNEKNSQDEKNIKEEIKEHYYKVNGLNKIKLMIYDFEQEMVIDKGIKKDIKSEVENIIINYKLKIPCGIDEETNDPAYKINKYLLRYSSSELKKEKSSISNKNVTNIVITNQKNIDEKQEIYKRIEKALNNNKKEKLITRFIISTSFSLLVLLAIASFALYFILYKLNTLSNNLLLLIYSTNLRHYTNMGVYYVREIIILNMNGSKEDNLYNNFPNSQTRKDYIQNVTENLKEVFFYGHKYMELMMSTNLNLDKNNSFYLHLNPFITKITKGQFQNRNITSTLLVSIVQLYSFYYRIIISEDFQDPLLETFNFVYNAINTVGIGIEEVIKIYLSEIQIRRNQDIIFTGIIIVVIFFLYIGIYFVIKITYIQIMNRKKSYITVLHDISLSLIREMMIKCERYIRKINPNELLISEEKNDNIEDSISLSNNEENIIFNESIKKSNNKNILKNNIVKKNFKDISKNRVFRIKIIIILLLSFFYIFIILWKFINLINTIEVI